MPAMHLISVDLPAPLSPTSAMTSPARTSKSTSVSASTEPKLLRIPRASSIGVAEAVVVGVGSAVVGHRQIVSRAPPAGALDGHAVSYLQYCLYSPRQTSLFLR